MPPFEFRKPIKSRPPLRRDGQVSFVVPAEFARKRDEIALIIQFISERRLFGLAYLAAQPDYFDQMPQNSGVFICPLVPTRMIFPQAVRPGDIDLLVIPYENDDLILHRVMAIEAKALRVQFTRQGKSPNEFGFSQASALLDLGIPYVALAHLIVSDESPEEHWLETGLARIIDTHGRAELLPNRRTDMMPSDLIERVLGRLQRHCASPELGLISAYLDLNSHPSTRSIWFPDGRRASINPNISLNALEAIADFFHANYRGFFDNPRHDPVVSK